MPEAPSGGPWRRRASRGWSGAAHAPYHLQVSQVWRDSASGVPKAIIVQRFRWGNRRRCSRRIGAAAALERQGAPTLRRDEVSSEVTAAPTGARSRPSAQVPGVVRRAMRGGRDGSGGEVHRQAIATTITSAGTTEGSRARHAAGDADHGVRAGVHDDGRAGDRRCASLRARAGSRAPREARARRTVPPQHRSREDQRAAPPPLAPDHDPGERRCGPPCVAVRQRGRPGYRAGARGRRGSR